MQFILVQARRDVSPVVYTRATIGAWPHVIYSRASEKYFWQFGPLLILVELERFWLS